MSSISIDTILDAADAHQASDVFLQEDEIPRLKIREQIVLLGDEPVTLQHLTGLWQVCGGKVESDMDRDSGLISHTHVRFRVNLHRSMGRLAAVLRRIKTEIPPLPTLGLPVNLLTRWAQRSFGLVLITGPTGTGKSTTIASMLHWMNMNLARHIVTIEDPVEYIFENQQCHFTQREVGRDTTSFAHGLRSALRQAPDVIFVGEIRDYETALIALQAAETGHLVLATMHSERVADTMERFTHLFPDDKLNQGVHLLADQMLGVMCQRLVPKKDGGLQLLVEHIENGGAMREWIRKREAFQIKEHLAKGNDPNAQSFLKAAVEACRSGKIEESVAAQATSNEAEFKRAMRGVQ
ncbi:twitching motility protein PilT [Roseimicrobium gellanilyticum]|uniref:Twitching motility protein PilT n=1 Tax=Roseimicrobium gellanilyticum TaxID=748857 RepID=A0A366H694_9BACT|nr:ATPase, T2SS/T4P/T4SS family [Roseimicrobium gellanilyticum]RBP37639.1 twitching motility protein PilT [Roseimicrobium gellanilyticum]